MSPSFRAFFIAAMAYLPLMAVHASGNQVHRGDLAEGFRLFNIHCASCHGEAADGKGQVKTTPSPRDLRDPSRMNLLSDRQVYEMIEKGGPAFQRARAMPAYGQSLSTLERWSLVSYLRSRHLSITDFFPFAAKYWGEPYTLDQWGLQRYEQVIGSALPEGERTYVVLGIYRGTQGPEGPMLIPDDPRELAKVDRASKMGYIVFVPMEIPGIPGGKHVLGISMDTTGIVFDVKANTDDRTLASRIEETLSTVHGEGDKRLRERINLGRRSAALADAWNPIYFRAMEAVVMFDKAEYERHWADAAFGRGEDPEAFIEEGEFDVQQ